MIALKPFLFISLEGLVLTSEELTWLQHPAVAGVVLFARNYQDRMQLRRLTQSIYAIHPKLWVAVDQEGGRVQRFRAEFTTLPPMAYWGKLFLENVQTAKTKLKETIQTMCTELRDVGVNVDLMPVLDVDHGLSEIIGERSLSSNISIIVELAMIIIDTLHAEGFPAVGKHFPGHGGVRADSHLTLPTDLHTLEYLLKTDMQPFAMLASYLDWIMPAHILFPAVDSLPVGFSKTWLQTILRQQLHFKGKIISDDLSMLGAATMGSYNARVEKAREAGCDFITVCNQKDAIAAVLSTL